MARTLQSLYAVTALTFFLLCFWGAFASSDSAPAWQVASLQQLVQHQQLLRQHSPVSATLTAPLDVKENQSRVQHPSWRRRLVQSPGWKPSRADQDASKHAGHFSASHAVLVSLLCAAAMAVLGFIGFKAVQWYERVKRPGYVELQSMDNAYHKPWAF